MRFTLNMDDNHWHHFLQWCKVNRDKTGKARPFPAAALFPDAKSETIWNKRRFYRNYPNQSFWSKVKVPLSKDILKTALNWTAGYGIK